MDSVQPPWWQKEGIYGSQLNPLWQRPPGADALPRIAPADDLVELWSGRGISGEGSPRRAATEGTLGARSNVAKYARHILSQRPAERGFGFVPYTVLWRALNETREQALDASKPAAGEPPVGNAVGVTSSGRVIFSPTGSASDLALAAVRTGSHGRHRLAADVPGKWARREVAAEDRVLGVHAAEPAAGELLVVSRATNAARAFYEREGSRLSQVARVDSDPGAPFAGVCVSEVIPGEVFLLKTDGQASVVRIDRERNCYEAPVRAAHHVVRADGTAVQWRGAARATHPRAALLSDARSVWRLDMGANTCNSELDLESWNLPFNDQQLLAVHRHLSRPFHLVLATPFSVYVGDERHLGAPLVQWRLSQRRPDRLVLASCALEGLDVVAAAASGPAPDTTCMTYTAGSGAARDDGRPLFLSEPAFLSTGPPLSHLPMPRDPIGAGLSVVDDAHALLLQADRDGRLTAQLLSSGSDRARVPDSRTPGDGAAAEPANGRGDVALGQLNRLTGDQATALEKLVNEDKRIALEELDADVKLAEHSFFQLPRTNSELERFVKRHGGVAMESTKEYLAAALDGAERNGEGGSHRVFTRPRTHQRGSDFPEHHASSPDPTHYRKLSSIVLEHWK